MRAAAWVIEVERVRGRSERVRLREMFRDESECVRESYYFNQPVIKIIFFFFLLS